MIALGAETVEVLTCSYAIPAMQEEVAEKIAGPVLAERQTGGSSSIHARSRYLNEHGAETRASCPRPRAGA